MLHGVHLCTYLSLGQEACSVHKQGVVVSTPGSQATPLHLAHCSTVWRGLRQSA